jgi:hypothetical protein
VFLKHGESLLSASDGSNSHSRRKSQMKQCRQGLQNVQNAHSLKTHACLLLVSLLVTACGSSTEPQPQQQVQRDPTKGISYGRGVEELAGINREAKESFQAGKADEAAALIQKGEPLSKRLISVPRPTLAATEAAADLDQLYGQMLFSNRNYGWARLLFQKNVARWKYWQPQTPETARRLAEAQSAIEECDRKIRE